MLPSKWHTQGWDISHKSLDFHTSLKQPCREVSKGQLGFMSSSHANPHSPFSYIYTHISPFQKTENSQKNPSQNYRQIARESIGYINFLRAWLFPWVLETRKQASFSRGQTYHLSLLKSSSHFHNQICDRQTIEWPVKNSFLRQGRHKVRNGSSS